MNKIFKLFKTGHVGIFSMLLMLLAAFLGADVSMAMADPAGAIADEKGLETQLPGTVASGTQIKDADLEDREIDDYIAKFRPYMFPLDTDLRMAARQSKVKSYEVDHYASGTENVKFNTTGAVSNSSAKAEIVVLPVSKEARETIAAYDILYFYEVDHYENGVAKGKGAIFQVTEKNSTEIKIEALDGPVNDGSMYVQDIPNGASFIVSANALAESQMQCEPENYQPRPRTVYLQKSAVNIVMTDHWKEIAKKVPFIEQDIKDDALYKFRRKRAINNWIGRMSKRKVMQGANMGQEYVYTSEGVLHQLNSRYGIGDEVTYEDLIALTKMQFTDYSANNEATAYCGKNFYEKVLNIDYVKHKDIEMTTTRTELGIDISSFKTSFGRLNFVHDPTLNDVGYADFCAIVDIRNAVHYYMTNGKDYKVDMKKGAGENREASRDIHIETDCLALKGYNSILVGPSNMILDLSGDDTTLNYSEEDAIPTESLTDGMIVLLTAASGGWAEGDLIVYDAETKTWSRYSGVIEA